MLNNFYTWQIKLFLSKELVWSCLHRVLWNTLLCSCQFSWLRTDGRSPSGGCCAAALVVPPGSNCDGSCLDMSLCGSWGGQREPQMRLKLCLVWAGVISSRSKWSMRADSLLFFPVMTPQAIKPWVMRTLWLLGLKDKKSN